MQVATHCGAVRFTCHRLTCRHAEPTLASLPWSQNRSRNPRISRFRITRARSYQSPTRVPSRLFSDGRLPFRLEVVNVVPIAAVVERRISDVARRRAIHRTAVHAATDARVAATTRVTPHAAFTGATATRGAALARIDSFCFPLPLSPSLFVRRHAAPPLRATESAAISAVEGSSNADGTAASSPPSPSPSPASSPSSSADASDSSASSAAPASAPPQSKRQFAIGALQQLPAVSPAAEIIGTALRRAKHEISGPLGRYVRLFPRRSHLHPFERCLVELTLGEGVYEEVLSRVDALRKRVLDVGKNAASLVNKTSTVKEAEQATAQGMAQVEELYTRNSHVVERLKEITKRLRAIPVVRPDLPTLCLVGAPNVGKSSLVRAISTGKPEVCNYPFTTRGISMGHFYVDGQKHQVTDTPGLLSRPDEQRNSIELLTIAAITHLPTAVLFVHDPSEECGVNRLKQYQLYSEIKTRFADRVWIDVISKCDLPAAAPTEEPPGGQSEEADGDRRSGSDRRDTAAVLLGEAEAVREAHGEEIAEVAVRAASVAVAWEAYKAHGGPAAALRVSTVAGVGVEE
ncbi:unnamed protein product, partial [Closterium sp. Naga37s-1]